MTRSWRHRGESAGRVLGAVTAYLQLLAAEWDSLTDVQRRNAVLLALEAADGTRHAGVREPHGPGEGAEPERPNA